MADVKAQSFRRNEGALLLNVIPHHLTQCRMEQMGRRMVALDMLTAIKIDAGQLVGVWPEPPASLPSCGTGVRWG